MHLYNFNELFEDLWCFWRKLIVLLCSQSEKVLSFIPPDGNFRLISYHISSQSIVAIPIYIKHFISFREGRLDITVGPKQTMGRQVFPNTSFYLIWRFILSWINFYNVVMQVENVSVEIPMPKAVLNCTLVPSQGKYSFDPVGKVLQWDVGKIDVTKLPNLRGSVNLI